jgi:AraC family transcriptional regulator
MEMRIEKLTERKLVGKRLKMSFSNNQTPALWRSFMPRRREIQNPVGTELYSLQIYPPAFFDRINPQTEFEKWAATQVTDFAAVPPDMEALTLPGGLYAVFLHRGAANAAPTTFQYIHSTWLPNSEYKLDDRPHFELLGEKYKNDDPASEEEFWIPIQPKP